VQRSSYPGQRDSERDRIESFYQLIAGILRSASCVDGSPAGQAQDNTRGEDRNASGRCSDREKHT
jgi:hypothetical protein